MMKPVGTLSLAALGAAGGLALFLGAGCGSLSKARMEERLLGLEKNAPLRALGLQRNSVSMTLEGPEKDYEVVFAHQPSAAMDAGERLPVVLVHGTPSTLFTWTELMLGGDGFEGLFAQRDVYAIEVIGHGLAPGRARPYGFQRCAEYVRQAIRGLGLERVHLVGQSYGGEFVWRVALDDPELVASLTVMDSSGYERPPEGFLPEEVAMREMALANFGYLVNSQKRIEKALAPHFPAEVPPGRVEEFYLVADNAENWRAMCDLAKDENGTREGEIPNIQAPTLVLWGADDIAYPPAQYAERFARDIPAATLKVMEDTGHYPHEQRPAEVVSILNDYYDEVER